MRCLDTSTKVHLRSSFLFSPESFKDPFPLSVQYRSVTREAPRGGFLLRLYVAVRGHTLILFTALKRSILRCRFIQSTHGCQRLRTLHVADFKARLNPPCTNVTKSAETRNPPNRQWAVVRCWLLGGLVKYAMQIRSSCLRSANY